MLFIGRHAGLRNQYLRDVKVRVLFPALHKTLVNSRGFLFPLEPLWLTILIHLNAL